MSDTPQLLSSKVVRKWGGSYVVTLEKSVRQSLGLKAGDRVVFRKVSRFVIIAVERACSVAPLSEEEKQQARALLGA